MYSRNEFLSEVAALPVHPRFREVATTLHFDEYHELLWAGTKSGGLYVYECPTLASYSWCRGHTKKVEAIKNTRWGAVSISANCIRVHTHGGQPNLTHKEVEDDLRCMVLDTSHGVLQGSRLILGRDSGFVSQFDIKTSRYLNSGKLVDTSICAVETVVQGIVACGVSDGKIVLVDPRTGLKAQHQVLGHRGGIADIASKHNFLVSCGYEMHAGSLIVDNVIKVYDSRSLREKLASVVFPAGPSYLQFHPKFSSTLVIASTADIIGMQEIQSDNIPLTVQVNTDNSGLLSFGISSSGDLIGMGGGRGMLRLEAASRHATVNLASAPHSRPRTNTPSSLRLKENDPFFLAPQHTSITGTLLSDWDPSTIIDVGKPPRVITESAARSIHQLCSSSTLDPSLGTHLWCASNSRVEPMADAGNSFIHYDSRSPSPMKIDLQSRLPDMYHPVEIKRSEVRRFEEFNFGHYNRTERFSGLENSIPNSYCNALLQALFFHPSFRRAMLERQPNPSQEISLLDEMTFLFRMLGESPAPPCQASNFLRALYHIQEAGALGLLVNGTDRKSQPLPEKICQLYRFIMEKLNQEWKNLSGAKNGAAPGYLESIFAIKSNLYTKCLNGEKCERMQSVTSFSVDLLCLEELQESPKSVRFCDILAASLQSDCVLQAWFDEIRGDQHVRQTRISAETGKVLVVDCSSLDWADLAKRVVGLGNHQTPWLPSMLCIRQSVETGELTISEGETIESLGLSDEEYSLASSEEKSNVSVFELTGMVANILDEQHNDSWGHFVAHMKVLPQYFRRHQGIRRLVEEIPSPTTFPFQETRLMDTKHCTHGTSTKMSDEPLAVSSLFPSENMDDSMVPDDSSRVVSTTGAQDSGASGECSSLDSPKSSCASGPDPPGKKQWLLINDFSLRFTSPEEVQNLHGGRKSPCLLFYTKRSELRSNSQDRPVELVPALDHWEFCELCKSRPLQGLNSSGPYMPVFKSLEFETEAPGPGTLFALDAEFVVQGPPNGVGLADNRKDGSARMILGRVSVVRGEGPMAGVCCIDDYVRPLETVQDYLTRFSGLVEGDLDVSTSQRYLTTLKHMYVKLRYLVDCGCIFVGHGLKMDFRIINIVVPSNQIVDTVELFHLKKQRMLSLRFLASYLLGINIQSNTHDSIEDARTALQLFEIYNKLMKEGTFDTKLREMYNWGGQYGWDPRFWLLKPGEMHEANHHCQSSCN